MSWRRRALGLAIPVVMAAWTHPVQARPGHPSHRQERAARRHPRAGREPRELEQIRLTTQTALANKDYALATQALTEFYQRTRQPEGLYLLAEVAQAEGRLLAAQDLMSRFLSDPRYDPAASVAEEVEAKRLLALPTPAHGTISVVGEHGALVTVDGRLVGALPLARPLLVEPGRRTLALTDRRHNQEEEIEVAAGRVVEVTYDRNSTALLSAELPGVLVLEQYGALAADSAATLAQAVAAVLQAERLSPFPVELALAQAGIPPTDPCMQTAGCQLKIARKNELDYVLHVELVRPADTLWQLRLTLQDVEVGDVAAHGEPQCAACDGAKLAQLLRDELPPLLLKARQRPRGELTVTSQPAGAQVLSRGQLLGTTPLRQTLPAGPYAIEVALTGYVAQSLPASVALGEKTALAVELQPVPPPPPVPPPVLVRRGLTGRPRWRLVLGGVTLGAGVLLAGFGGSALAVADQCVVEAIPPAQVCRQRLGTTAVGTGLLVSGVVALGVGSLLWALPAPRSRAPRSAAVAETTRPPVPDAR